MSLSYSLAGLALLLALAVPASAQPRMARTSGPAFSAPASVQGGAVLRNYDPASEQSLYILGGTNAGFVYGTNSYGDTSKMTCFAAPPTPIAIQSINIPIAVATAGTDVAYDVVVRSGGPGLDGSGGPGTTVLTRQGFTTAGVTATTPPIPIKAHALTTPLIVATSFCAGLEWAPSVGANAFGIASTALPLSDPPSPFDWERWDTGRWYNMNQAWGSPAGTWRELMQIDVVYTTVTTAAEEGPATARRMSLAPNPARHATTLAFEVASPQTVQVEVYSLTGQRVWSRAVPVGTGMASVPVPVSDLAAGVYAVRVTGDDFAASRRLTVVR